MNTRSLLLISCLIGILALVAAGTGLLYNDGGETFTFVTSRGEEVQIYGQGLYRNDSLMIGAGNRGSDAVVLGLGLPLLALAMYLTKKGSNMGKLLLTGVLAFFLYLYATFALSIAYNQLFLIYVALLALSLYGFILAIIPILAQDSSTLFPSGYKKKWIGRLMMIAGIFTALAWLSEPLADLLTGHEPLLRNTPTLFTHALDLAVILPPLIYAGWKIVKGDSWGYLLGFPPLFVLAMLCPAIVSMTISQILAGVEFTPGEFAVFICAFVILGVFAGAALVSILKNLKAKPSVV